MGGFILTTFTRLLKHAQDANHLDWSNWLYKTLYTWEDSRKVVLKIHVHVTKQLVYCVIYSFMNVFQQGHEAKVVKLPDYPKG